MTSFPELARRVRDVNLPPHERRSRLSNCLHHFAPFGFHSTRIHLATAHRIPRRIETDPESLVRALDELEAARALVLPQLVAFAARRHVEKQEGRRVPGPHPWYSWGCHALAYCPDPSKRPAEPLLVVVRRVLDAWAAGVKPAGRCFVCGDQERRPQRVCRICGVLPGGRSTPF